MKSFATVAAALFAGSVLAHPTEKRAADIDGTVLNFALTLEHLENAFYTQAIKNFTQADFAKAGYDADYYNDLKYIAVDEASHVQLLTSALKAAGVTPVAACDYYFPYTDVPSFITLSSVLEGVGVSAYLGGAPLITSKDYLSVAASILVTEALHTSMQRLAIGEVPNANPYGTPLDPTSVYTLAAEFITSCPKSNPTLPFTPFPMLQVNVTTCTCEGPECFTPSEVFKRDNTCTTSTTGSKLTFEAASDVPAGSFVSFVSGLNVTSVAGTIKGKDITAAIPAGLSGQTYVFVTKKDLNGTFADAPVLFGPSIIEIKVPTLAAMPKPASSIISESPEVGAY